jgi:hypothetical protein
MGTPARAMGQVERLRGALPRLIESTRVWHARHGVELR